ncbi:hypothetical protein [Corynebacterium sp. J010B-136]|nr:hypothetical protein [Corynebacterium sp. J010B-136]
MSWIKFTLSMVVHHGLEVIGGLSEISLTYVEALGAAMANSLPRAKMG